MALLTPARTKVPAVRAADAALDTTSSSSAAAVAPVVFCTPKLPATVTKPPTVAWSPLRTRAA